MISIISDGTMVTNELHGKVNSFDDNGKEKEFKTAFDKLLKYACIFFETISP